MQESIAQIPINEYMEGLHKTFDIKTFNKNKKGYDYNFTTDSTVVEQYITSNKYHNKYIERIQPKNSYIQVYSEYNIDGTLRKRGGIFPNKFSTGIWRTYDKDGNLIEEIDRDTPYKITFQDILVFMKKRGLKIGSRELSIGRGESGTTGELIWVISYEKADKTGMHYVHIHRITGEIVTEKDRPYDLFCGMDLAKKIVEQRRKDIAERAKEKEEKEKMKEKKY